MDQKMYNQNTKQYCKNRDSKNVGENIIIYILSNRGITKGIETSGKICHFIALQLNGIHVARIFVISIAISTPKQYCKRKVSQKMY